MHDFQRSLLFSIMLSISFGPIALIILRQSMMFGRLSAVPSALGAAIADLLYAVTALMGAALVNSFIFKYRDLLVLFSIGYLFYLGVKIINSKKIDMSVSRRAGFFSVFALTMANPLTVVAIASYVVSSNFDESTVNIPSSLAGFFIGSFFCQLVYVFGGGVLGGMFFREVGLHKLNWLSGFF